jgi:septum formation protein
MRLILASSSPRRSALLSLLKIPFDICDPRVEEAPIPGLSAAALARALAQRKAGSCAAVHPGSLLIGSDTLIALGDEIIGKPVDERGAMALLERLQGRQHTIHTAVAVGTGGTFQLHVEMVRVWMRPCSSDQLARYVAVGESIDKAGAYAIQGAGAALIERIEGDFTAAMGLPLRAVASLLAKQGIAIPVDVDRLYRHPPIAPWAKFSASSSCPA